MMSAIVLKGAWLARWGNWAVWLHSCGKSWAVTVRRWQPDAGAPDSNWQHSRVGFGTQGEAVAWACDVMRDDGAQVKVLGAPSITLETLLRFSPTTEPTA